MTFEAVHKKACPGCGAAFSCGSAQGGCWCEGLPRLTPVAEVDCLCLACLKAAIANQRPDQAPG